MHPIELLALTIGTKATIDHGGLAAKYLVNTVITAQARIHVGP